MSWLTLNWSRYPLTGAVWVKGAGAEICWWWPRGWCFPAIGSAEVGCTHTWKSDVLLAAALAVPYRGGTAQRRPWGTAQPRSGCSFDFTPSLKCPGFNVGRQVPRLAGLAELVLAGWQDAGKGLPTFPQLAPPLSGCQDHQFAHQAARHAAERALAAPFHAGGQPGVGL